MRKSNLFLAYIALGLTLLCLLFAHSLLGQRRAEPALRYKGELVERLALTDLCIFTEARYTRHPVMADLNTPFQDHPMSIEHYPSGSLMLLPRHLKGGF